MDSRSQSAQGEEYTTGPYHSLGEKGNCNDQRGWRETGACVDVIEAKKPKVTQMDMTV